jgi:hypothetical protein
MMKKSPGEKEVRKAVLKELTLQSYLVNSTFEWIHQAGSVIKNNSK